MDPIIKTLEQFVATQVIPVSVFGVLINIILSAAFALLLGFVYTRYGNSLSNRRLFARNFILLSVTTMLVISIIKSSLALSLGLVGALSIVRFRAAIKDPEELAYLFICVAIGLGFGAGQTLITIVAALAICLIIWIKHLFNRVEESQNLLLTVSGAGLPKIELKQVIEILKKYCSTVNLRRFDETKEIFEAAFLVELKNMESLEKAKSDIRGLNESVNITFLDNKGII